MCSTGFNQKKILHHVFKSIYKHLRLDDIFGELVEKKIIPPDHVKKYKDLQDAHLCNARLMERLLKLGEPQWRDFCEILQQRKQYASLAQEIRSAMTMTSCEQGEDMSCVQPISLAQIRAIHLELLQRMEVDDILGDLVKLGLVPVDDGVKVYLLIANDKSHEANRKILNLLKKCTEWQLGIFVHLLQQSDVEPNPQLAALFASFEHIQEPTATGRLMGRKIKHKEPSVSAVVQSHFEIVDGAGPDLSSQLSRVAPNDAPANRAVLILGQRELFVGFYSLGSATIQYIKYWPAGKNPVAALYSESVQTNLANCTDTCELTFVAFGDEAVRNFSDREAESAVYFKDFFHCLHCLKSTDVKVMSVNVPVTKKEAVSISLITVLADMLHYIASKCKYRCDEWIFVVQGVDPTPLLKFVIHQAATKALTCFSNSDQQPLKLRLMSESQCALAGVERCMCEFPASLPSDGHPGQCLAVRYEGSLVTVGGKVKGNQLQAPTPIIESSYDLTVLDELFMIHFHDALGDNPAQVFGPEANEQFLKNFEAAKLSFTGKDDMRIELPSDLLQHRSIPCYSSYFSVEGYLIVRKEKVMAMFHTAARRIAYNINRYLNECNNIRKHVQGVAVSGTIAESRLLQQELEKLVPWPIVPADEWEIVYGSIEVVQYSAAAIPVVTVGYQACMPFTEQTGTLKFDKKNIAYYEKKLYTADTTLIFCRRLPLADCYLVGESTLQSGRYKTIRRYLPRVFHPQPAKSFSIYAVFSHREGPIVHFISEDEDRHVYVVE